MSSVSSLLLFIAICLSLQPVGASDKTYICDGGLPSKSAFDHLPSDTVNALPHFYSKRLQLLFAKAKAASPRPIRFSQIPTSSRNTSAMEASQAERVILLRSGMGQLIEENAIAHELFHIILQEQGFAALVHVPETKTEDPAMLKALGYTITSCVDDALIDRKMARLGFNPRTLNHEASENLKQSPPPIPNTQLIRDGNALLIVCYSYRIKSQFDQIEQTWMEINPDIVQRSHILAQQMGDIKCTDARSCFSRKKHIRDVLRYSVTFCNPASGKYE